MGLEFLVNRFERFRRFWEHYLCFLVRGKVMEWELAAIKRTDDGNSRPA
jgi:hypothetical protein